MSKINKSIFSGPLGFGLFVYNETIGFENTFNTMVDIEVRRIEMGLPSMMILDK